MIRTVSAIIVLAATALLPPAAAPQPPRLRVAAASDLKFALDEAIARFTAMHPGVRVEAVYGSSGNFHAQLRQRAPFDVFLSADMAYVRDLIAGGIGGERDLFAYAVGHLVVWVPNRSTLPIAREGLGALRAAKQIAIANPRHAPYGRAAEAALRSSGVWPQVEPRMVFGENVAQAAQFVQSGAADAGLIPKSLAVAPAMRGAGRFSEVPSNLYPQVLQGGLILPWAASRPEAERFRDFLTGAEGRTILAAYGFGFPD